MMLAGESPMKKEDMKRMLFVLGKEHCLDVMINVYKNDWQTASEVARDLNIHHEYLIGLATLAWICPICVNIVSLL